VQHHGSTMIDRLACGQEWRWSGLDGWFGRAGGKPAPSPVFPPRRAGGMAVPPCDAPLPPGRLSIAQARAGIRSSPGGIRPWQRFLSPLSLSLPLLALGGLEC